MITAIILIAMIANLFLAAYGVVLCGSDDHGKHARGNFYFCFGCAVIVVLAIIIG
jgi:hypothetical protein